MKLRAFLRALRLRKLSVALITLAAVAVSLLITLMQTPLYSSTANLFVAAGNGTEKPDNPSQFAELRIQSYVEVFDGDTIAKRVIQRLKLDESPADLSDQIHASADSKSVVLTVRVMDPSADRAKLLADAVANEFIAFLNDLETASSDAGPIKATLVDAPDTPTSPSTPNLPLNLGIGLGVGLLLGLLWALLRERADTTVRTASVLEDATDAPMLGAILFDEDAFDQPTIRDLDHYDPRVEGYRILRTALQFVHPDPLVGEDGVVPSWPAPEAAPEPRVYVVTSALPDEGKTTTAINLALILAEGGERVVLVEADLRRPTVSEYLALNPAIGLTTTLIGRTTLDEAIQEVGALDILTSGRRPPNPAEMVKSQPMHALIETLREQYTYVLIDAPPLIPVTDACLLAAASDGVILVTRYGDTKEIELASAVNRLKSVNGRIIGTILNMTPANDAVGYGYGYGYAPNAIGNGPGRGKDVPRPKPRDKARGKGSGPAKAQEKAAEEPLVAPAAPEVPEVAAEVPAPEVAEAPAPVEVPVEADAPADASIEADAPVEPPIQALPAWLQDLPFDVPVEAAPPPSGKESRWSKKAKTPKPPKPPKAAKPPKPPKPPRTPKAPKNPKRQDVVVEEVPYASLLSRLGPAATPAEPEPETNELEMSGQSLLEQIESAMALAETHEPVGEVDHGVVEVGGPPGPTLETTEPDVVDEPEPNPEVVEVAATAALETTEPETTTSDFEGRPSGPPTSITTELQPEVVEEETIVIVIEDEAVKPEPEVVEVAAPAALETTEPETTTSDFEGRPSGPPTSITTELQPEVVEEETIVIEDEAVKPEPEVVEEAAPAALETTEPESTTTSDFEGRPSGTPTSITTDEAEPEPEPEPEPAPERIRDRGMDEPSRPMVWPASWGVQTAGSFVDSESADDPVETTHRFPGARPTPSNVPPAPSNVQPEAEPDADEEDLVGEVDPVAEPPRAED